MGTAVQKKNRSKAVKRFHSFTFITYAKKTVFRPNSLLWGVYGFVFSKCMERKFFLAPVTFQEFCEKFTWQQIQKKNFPTKIATKLEFSFEFSINILCFPCCYVFVSFSCR